MDSLRINERLEQLRAADVRSIDKNDLIDLNQVTIDETKPVPERVAEFMRQIQNPYCFRIGGCCDKGCVQGKRTIVSAEYDRYAANGMRSGKLWFSAKPVDLSAATC